MGALVQMNLWRGNAHLNPCTVGLLAPLRVSEKRVDSEGRCSHLPGSPRMSLGP